MSPLQRLYVRLVRPGATNELASLEGALAVLGEHEEDEVQRALGRVLRLYHGVVPLVVHAELAQRLRLQFAGDRTAHAQSEVGFQETDDHQTPHAEHQERRLKV